LKLFLNDPLQVLGYGLNGLTKIQPLLNSAVENLFRKTRSLLITALGQLPSHQKTSQYDIMI